MDDIHFINKKFEYNRLSAEVVVPKKIEKYVYSNSLFIQYDQDITADESILNIPLVTTALPLAWITNTNIYVDKLDSTFKKTVDRIQQEFISMFPKLKFNSRLNVGELVENHIRVKDLKNRTALFFSGGVDSTYSMITNLDLKPKLIMIWGIDGYPYPQNSDYWENVIKRYTNKAKKKELDIYIVKTNAIRVLHNRRIEHDFHQELLEGDLWVRFQFALFILPLVAPLSVDRFDQILLAAGHAPSYDFTPGPEAIEPIVEKIFWADLHSKLSGFIPRNEKILELKDTIENEEISFRVCQRHKILGSSRLNCSSCEKCYRTILPLLLSNIDPNICGFTVTESTFPNIKDYFKKEKIPALHIDDQWKPIQQMIPNDIDTNYLSASDFFKWLKNIELSKFEKDVWFYHDLYNRLPWPLAKILDEFYKFNNINIHDHSPIRKQKTSLPQ